LTRCGAYGEIELIHARHEEFGVFCQGRSDRREEHPNRGTWRSERKRSPAHSRIKGGPVVVDGVVDPQALSLPRHVPFHVAKNFT
jgi:hypothetical protein